MRLVTFATIALLLMAVPASAYVVVRTDGTKFEAAEAPEFKDGAAYFTLPGGSRGSVPEAAIDKNATEKANAEGAAKPAENAGVVTNEALAKGEEAKAAGFTNEDLAKAAAEETKPAAGVVTNEALAKTDEAKSGSGVVTNEDLANVEGNLTVSSPAGGSTEGAATAEGGDEAAAPETPDEAKSDG